MSLRGKLVLLFLFPLTLVPGYSHALPFFSRQVGRDCTFCHTVIPKLNERGLAFLSNGYRFPAEGQWKEVSELNSIPASMEMEAEGMYDRVKSGGANIQSSNLNLDEFEFATAGAMGREGKVSAIGMLSLKRSATGFNLFFNQTFLQINDIAGPSGEGVLNLRVGQWYIGLPFLNPLSTPITNRFLAEKVLNVLTTEQRAVEFNGSVVTEEDSFLPTHRYSVGVERQNINSPDKLSGYYATYSATFNEAYSVGALYRGGKEKNGLLDANARKYGFGIQAEKGPFVAEAGYFRAKTSGLSGANDYMAEIIYKPLSKVSFGGRYETMKFTGKKTAKSQSVMARYNILSNVYAQVEVRGLSDKDHTAGINENEERLRAILTAVF